MRHKANSRIHRRYSEDDGDGDGDGDGVDGDGDGDGDGFHRNEKKWRNTYPL